jgi:hypothetical protein
MNFLDAVVRVLTEESGPMHWTAIQDAALRRGYLDPFTQGDIRRGVLASLSEAVRSGKVERVGTGVYRMTRADREG